MFSFFSPTTTSEPQNITPEVPNTRLERNPSSSGVRPEDAKYADLVLLPNRKNEEDFLIKVGNNSPPRALKKGGGGGGKGAAAAEAAANPGSAKLPHSSDSDNFDVITSSAFDMVDVGGGKVPRYINNPKAQVKGLGSRKASGEEWVVVSPSKPPQRAH